MPFFCAFGCKNVGAVMHVFPNPQKYPERYKAWVAIVGAKLETLDPSDVYKKKRICDIHFKTEHKNRNNRLSVLAVPLLHLPDVISRVAASNVLISNVPANAAVLSLDVIGRVAASNVLISNVPTNAAVLSLDDIEQPVIASNIQPHASTSALLAVDTGDHRLINFKASAATVLADHNYFVKRPKRKNEAVNIRQRGPIQHKLSQLRQEISRLRRTSKTFKDRLSNMQKLNENVAFNVVTKHMTKQAHLFVHMQLQAKKKPKGRRFSIEEKVLSLSLYKRSPKCYRLLSKYFALPSAKAMKLLLSQIKLTPGINPLIFDKIKKNLDGKKVSERLCSLIFDEMSITPQISYNAQKDAFEGFSCNARNTFTNHVLVFMVKGLKNNFKQPIAYYYTNSLHKLELKNMIRDVVKHALESGLIIVNTVCDQSTVNVSTVTELVNDTKALFLRNGKEWRHDVIRINNKNIIPLYDTPHLIKGIRNNLINKNLTYTTNNKKNTIKWEYYQMVYAADKSRGELRLIDKLTEEHVNPDKINKMKVKSATQLFSHSVAAVADYLVSKSDLPEECRALVDFTVLLNKLFDTLNVSTLFVPNGKVYKGPVKKKSPHHQLWQNAKEMLKTVKYVKKIAVQGQFKETEVVVPSVSNLIKTIEGVENLWKVLSNKYKLDAMLTRNLNQDPIENFFGNIRSFGGRNVAPNTIAFEGAFKALMLNSFNAPHSRRANCEDDGSQCLQTLDFFLREKCVTPDVPENSNPTSGTINFNPDIADSMEIDAGQSNYVCGWVLRKCLKYIVKNCKCCRKELLDDTSQNKNNSFIKAKEYYVNKKWLCYPTSSLEKYFKEIQNTAISCLKTNVPKRHVKKTMISLINVLSECPFQCSLHNEKLKEYFINTTLNILIYSWCRCVNIILSGKIQYNDGEDEVKIAAQVYYNKYKKYKNKK